MDYSVVTPLYNEDETLKLLYERIKNVLDSLPGNYEIVFIDDGSTDTSYKLLKDIAASDKAVKVISLERNFGQHRALAAGILEASGDYIITIDADLQNPPEEIPKLLRKVVEGFDIVSGYRMARKDVFTRRFCSFLTNSVISTITGFRMKDYNSMLKVYKRETARRLAFEFMRSECNITMLVAKITHNIAEIEVEHDNRHAGATKYNFWKLISTFLTIFRYYETISNILAKEGDKPLCSIGRKIENGQEIIITR